MFAQPRTKPVLTKKVFKNGRTVNFMYQEQMYVTMWQCVNKLFKYVPSSI